MARTVTKLKVRNKPGKPAPAKALTLEEARQTYEMGSEERLVAELNGLNGVKGEQREALNKYNRQKTQAGKAFIAYLVSRGIDPGHAEVQMDDTAFGYDYSTGDTVPADKLYDLMKRGKIAEDQFLKSISVPKDQAKRVIGDHILITIMGEKKGKTLDIRTRELDVPVKEPKVVLNAPKPKPAGKIDRTGTTRAPGAAVRNPVKRLRRQRIAR